ncbi:HAMP domain-containing sensor histidine kinase [Leptolyngbya sp. FACHB-711]|uniref:sensor histidine kinase n=1 Tax=unclassified Leptolyngbya TaxID=2650499 RepID=UPI001685F13F|nr:HAMP domain-containing sensor histidine kinase [Leptolyngbya sp. FACHB-711]MBD1848974.1 HAMP domain-containing histidine kinase [Cyanobacteria bacterium FACHB-502]MBD2024885.1 HAMP domain-containing histidine kinase [Leptolyngbya sp. FACHB-711]
MKKLKTAKPSLGSRLFFSHIIVMIVGLLTLLAVGKISSPRFFALYLRQIEVGGWRVGEVRTQLIRRFEDAWSRGALWSVVVGATTAGGLSYLVTRRIVKPLIQMEEITKKFAAGQLEERVPSSEIPELDQLATSFNRMAATLEGVEQRRRELVSDLSHELRTPLTILRGYLEGLSDGTIEPSTEIYDRLAKETTRMQRLVNDLQELSKMEAGYLPIDARPLDLRPLLTGIVQRFADQLIAEDSPKLLLDVPAEAPMVNADPFRVEQIVVNLIGNAIRYTPEGSIVVQLRSEADKVWVAVIDTGQGIAEEDLPHVFERFWRADRSRNRNSGGTGIGLAICRRLVELQDGTIEAESQFGHGSTFKFSLPIANKVNKKT